MAKKTTKQAEKPQTEATVLEFTAKPEGMIEVLILMPGKYEDFKVGQKLKIG